MTDPRAGKTYYVSWEQWVKYCIEHGLNPYEQCEDGQDLGGGDSYTVVCNDDPPEEEEDHDEEWKNARDAYCCTEEKE